jgi:hypothetical protein
METSTKSSYLQEMRSRRAEELEANYDYELGLLDLSIPDGKSLRTNEFAARNYADAQKGFICR